MAASCDPVRVDAERVRGLQLLLDPDAEPPREGHRLPALWHWAALPHWSDPAVTGPDGHPRRPGPLADVTAVRRMFAGGEVTYSATPLRVGEQVTVETEVSGMRRKSGRSGDFVLATFVSQVRNLAGAVVVTERQDVVYTDPRPAPSAPAVPRRALTIVGRPLTRRTDGGFDLATDPNVLLRFSALTANGHRIHYDPDYAREIEQLPGLLVHGPFLNLALAHAAETLRPGATVRRVAHRNLAPLFCGQAARLTARDEGGRTIAEALSAGPDATVLARIEIEYDDPGAPADTLTTSKESA